jgi:nicotinamide-nucleotide amidase
MTTVRSAELIAVGTELLLGEIIDTNSAYLARELAARSVDVYWSQRVGDNRQRIAAAVRAALERVDLVLVCGGLGPTDDDLTREAIADVLGETPQVDGELERALRERFGRLGRDMPSGNLKQAWLIPSAESLANPAGTAPGWLVRGDVAGRERLLAALPGPPRELTGMWHEQLVPRLAFPAAVFAATTLKTQGIGESHVAEVLAGLTDAPNPSVATYARRDGVHVRVAAKGADAAAARALLAPTLAEVERRLAGQVWGRDDDDLAGLVLQRLRERGQRLAVVDGASGGALIDRLDEAAGPVDDGWPLAAAVIAWRDDAMAVLGAASPAPASPDPDVSQAAVAAHLAETGLARCAADLCLALAPWRAAAMDGRPAVVTWTTAWAIAGPDGTEARRVTLPDLGHGWRRERVAFTALVALWTQLLAT